MTLTRDSPASQCVGGTVDETGCVTARPPNLPTLLAEAMPVLTRIAVRICASASDAHDLVQDSVERALRQGIPANVASPRAWLITIMHNLFIDRCRSAARRPLHQPLDDGHLNITPLDLHSPEPDWCQVTLDDVRALLDTIDPEFREVYVLHTFEGRSYQEIAARLKISRVTVGSRLTRTRAKLRKLLAERIRRKKK